jgi:hypothetical protein
MVDHRASPGIPEELARAAGRDPKQSGEGKLYESALIQCEHCRTSVVLNADRQRPRAYCQPCDHYICDACDAQRNLPGYIHASALQLSDAYLEYAMKGMTLGSPLDVLQQPKMFVPSTITKE